MTEHDSVLENIEADIADAFYQFGLNPTNSARVKLRNKLVTLSSALEVEAGADGLEPENRASLNKLSDDLRTLAEAALVAPVYSLTGAEPPPRKKAPRAGNSANRRVIGRIFGDMLKGFLK